MEQHDPRMGNITVRYEVSRNDEGILEFSGSQKTDIGSAEVYYFGMVLGPEEGEHMVIGGVNGQSDSFIQVQLDERTVWIRMTGVEKRDRIPEIPCD